MSLYVERNLSSVHDRLSLSSHADSSSSMNLSIILAISAYYYFMRKMRRNKSVDDGTMLLPGTRFDDWELAFGEQ